MQRQIPRLRWRYAAAERQRSRGMIEVCLFSIQLLTLGGCPDCRDAVKRYDRHRVRSSDLKREQVETLARTLGRNLRYLNRLCARMQRLRFPMDDPLCQAAHQAREAMHKLYTEAYMAGERRGVR